MPTPILELIYQRAKEKQKTIILPESDDERVLQACTIAQKEKIAKIILIGNADQVNAKAKSFGISLDGVQIIDPSQFADTDKLREMLQAIYEKKNKPLTDEVLEQQLQNPLSFSALLLRNGNADGCLAGAVYTTASVLRVAFSILSTKAGVKTISSAFIMNTPSADFLFSDCAVVVEPTAEQLADIAFATAQTAREILNTEPKVAMLSFSTLGSTNHPASQKVAEATSIIKERNPDFAIDGEMQLDSAICPDIAKMKAPNSSVAGEANVLIFPSLEAGNIGYKLVQRLAGANAIGPILQGIAYPMNDLSRGATVQDIVGMIAVTACQGE